LSGESILRWLTQHRISRAGGTVYRALNPGFEGDKRAKKNSSEALTERFSQVAVTKKRTRGSNPTEKPTKE